MWGRSLYNGQAFVSGRGKKNLCNAAIDIFLDALVALVGNPPSLPAFSTPARENSKCKTRKMCKGCNYLCVCIHTHTNKSHATSNKINESIVKARMPNLAINQIRVPAQAVNFLCHF